MTVYRIHRKSQAWYGESVGILILDAAYPCVPGNVGNASTFPFPVRYERVTGASIDRLLNQQDPTLAEPFIQAAKNIQDQGVKAITGACGFMALFQREVTAAVDIPVFLSSLLQIPLIYQMTRKPVGIITANANSLKKAHFEAVNVTPDIPVIIAGMETQPEFSGAVLEEKGTLDSDKIQDEVVSVAEKMVKDHPDIGAMVLECSDLPPYAHAVQAAVQRPVFDFFTMIQYIHTSLVRTPFTGFM